MPQCLEQYSDGSARAAPQTPVAHEKRSLVLSMQRMGFGKVSVGRTSVESESCCFASGLYVREEASETHGPPRSAKQQSSHQFNYSKELERVLAPRWV